MFRSLATSILLFSVFMAAHGGSGNLAFGAGVDVAKLVMEANRPAGVVIENVGSVPAHLFCQSKDDKIGPADGLIIKPGEAIGWSFNNHILGRTLFWCVLYWKNQRVSWDVYRGNWHDAPNPVKWLIHNDGIACTWQNNRVWVVLHP